MRFDLIQPDDAGELLTVRRAAYVTEAQLYGDPHLPALVQTLDELTDDLARPDVVTIGAWEGHRLVGSVRVEIAGATATISRLAVVPDLQGQGIGSQLLMQILEYLPSEVTEVTVFTDQSAAGGIAELPQDATLTQEYLRRLVGDPSLED